MTENIATTITAHYTIYLIGRMSFSQDTQQLRLNPRIDTLTKYETKSPVTAFESFNHLLEIANVINAEIEEAFDTVNELDDDAPEEDKVINFARFFDVEENPSMHGLPIHAEGYSNLSVYISIQAISAGDTVHAIRMCSPDDFNQLIEFSDTLITKASGHV